jgi:hypothetical protein
MFVLVEDPGEEGPLVGEREPVVRLLLVTGRLVQGS